MDKKKAIHYYELAAMKGDATARYNLGFEEEAEGNMDRALKHHIIAVGSGYSSSLDAIKNLYMNGQATKDVYTAALHGYQIYLGEIKSVQRDKAADTRDDTNTIEDGLDIVSVYTSFREVHRTKK